MTELERIISLPTPLVALKNELTERGRVNLYVKRDDLTHPHISGNKYRKLKYNLIKAKHMGYDRLLSFGGAHSNHVYALSAAAHLFSFGLTLIIRGDELHKNSGPTLKFASDMGAELIFTDRTSYRNKEQLALPYLKTHYIIPEGGSNEEAMTGVSEMTDEILEQTIPDYICCAAGTGGTLAGILSNSAYQGRVLGVPVLKNGDFIRGEVQKLLKRETLPTLELFTDYHFGGYGKKNTALGDFIENIKASHSIPLEFVYTGKLFFAVFDQISRGFFPENARIVLVHTGGLRSPG